MPLALAPRRKVVTPIGLDVGTSVARAVQLRRRDRAWQLIHAATWPLRRTSAADEGLRPLEERIRRALRHQDFEGRAFVAGMSQPDLELHALEIPRAGEETLTEGASIKGRADSVARWEIERLSHFEAQPTQTAHWWLPPGRGTRTTAIGVAVPQPAVKQIWEACGRAGAECRRVDATACALSRAGALLRPAGADEVWALLDLGARAARLVICVDRVPVLVRSLDSGGQGWTEKIAAALQVSAVSAELHKCDHGIRPAGMRVADSPGARPIDDQQRAVSELAGMIFAALRPDLERIATEVERSYEYVLQCYPGRTAADLILAGGAAALKRLDTYLSSRLGVPVRRAETYLDGGDTGLRLDPTLAKLREPLGAYLGAIGLAVLPEGKT